MILNQTMGLALAGFSVIDRGCCGIGRNRGQITCLPYAVPCSNRNQYMFWDAFHPTEAANAILAWRAYNGPPSDSYPINVQQMALIWSDDHQCCTISFFLLFPLVCLSQAMMPPENLCCRLLVCLFFFKEEKHLNRKVSNFNFSKIQNKQH